MLVRKAFLNSESPLKVGNLTFGTSMFCNGEISHHFLTLSCLGYRARHYENDTFHVKRYAVILNVCIYENICSKILLFSSDAFI